MTKSQSKLMKKGDMMNELTNNFNAIIDLIEAARQNAIRKVNEELIMLYFNVGKFLSVESKKSSYGDSYIDDVAKYIAENGPEIKGFNRRGLYRMRQFYETYKEDKIVSAALTQLSWTNHLQIMSKAKTDEERQFYVTLCIREKYSTRELERQIDSAYYERYMLSANKIAPAAVTKEMKNQFMDSYVLEFLHLPEKYSELDLKRAIIINLKNFILEIGKDFTFIGDEFRVQVGGRDFYIDLLFYHRGLSCLVAFELKLGKFEPEHIGKMNFYLEALDRDHKKENENPSVGVILCSDKDDEVVEYTMSRNLSPTMVSEYNLKLIDKKLLQKKLHEFTMIADMGGLTDETPI